MHRHRSHRPALRGLHPGRLPRYRGGHKGRRDAANTLTSASVTHVLGGWAQYLMAIIIFVFAYSSLLGNYTYAQVNMDFLQGRQHKHYACGP